ncbi:MAG: TonB-dependent receptor [Acidobacteria bacterium]|nr:TonB-dependent receptor [Acidobacteriota bacterium]
MFVPRFPWLCHVASLFLFFSTPVFAQTGGSISGCVEDSTEAAVPGATVILTSLDSSSRFQARTDEEGCFTIPGAASGSYDLRVLAEGFAAHEQQVTATDRVLGKIVLQVSPIRQTVMVTATRNPVSSIALGSSVDMIGRDTIEASTLRTTADLLRSVGSMTVTRTGNTGGITSLFVRGGDSDYTKVLVDGIPVNQPGGLYDFSHLSLDNVSRIEIVRGPQSALFGSDAISGVVQVFTRPGSGSPELEYGTETGSFGTYQQRAALRGGWHGFDLASTFSRFDTDNIGRNNDYRNATYTGNIGFTPDSRNSVRLTLLHGSVKAGTPGANAPGFTSFGPDNRMNRLERAAGISYQGLIGSRVTQNLAYRLYDHDQNFFSAFGVSTVFHTRHRVEYSGDIAVASAGPAGMFSYGFDYDRENALVARTPHSRDNYGFYVQQQINVADRVDVTGGIRLDSNTTFDTSVNPRLAVSFRVAPETRLRFSAGTGIKEPTFIENFSQNRFFFGNPDLRAEETRSWEIGAERSFWNDRVTGDVTWFDNRFRNVIQLIPRPDGSSRFENIGRTFSRGLEVRTRARIRRLSAHANYTFLEGRVQQSNQMSFPNRVGDPLLRRPKHSGDVSVMWSDQRWTLYWSTRYTGLRADSDFFTFSRPLFSNPAYIVSDAAFTYDFGRLISAYVRFENIFDRDYQEVLGYQALGRSAVIGTRVRLGGQK